LHWWFSPSSTLLVETIRDTFDSLITSKPLSEGGGTSSAMLWDATAPARHSERKRRSIRRNSHWHLFVLLRLLRQEVLRSPTAQMRAFSAPRLALRGVSHRLQVFCILLEGGEFISERSLKAFRLFIAFLVRYACRQSAPAGTRLPRWIVGPGFSQWRINGQERGSHPKGNISFPLLIYITEIYG